MATGLDLTNPRDRMVRHMYLTYRSLRIVLAALSFAFPLLLLFVGWYFGISLQRSMSSYYFAVDPLDRLKCSDFPMRGWFVGLMCAVSACLYAYKGFTKKENMLLNAAAICGVLVAIFPESISDVDILESKPCEDLMRGFRSRQFGVPVHIVAALSMFGLLAIVAATQAKKTLKYLPGPHKGAELWLRQAYSILSALMVLVPAGVVAVHLIAQSKTYVFWAEATAIWVFSSYWALKTLEMSWSEGELKAAQGDVTPELDQDWENHGKRSAGEPAH